MSAPSPKPVFLLAGGGGRRLSGPDPLLRAVFEASGRSAPVIAYIGAANDDNPGFLERMAARFGEAGAGRVTLAALAGARDETQVNRARKVLRGADVIFLSGGDVERGMRILRERGVIPDLRALYDEGVAFFGSSAGSIMLARQWVRWRDPDDDATAETFECLGLAPLVCDVHGEDEDWLELRALLRLLPDKTVGYGIPSGAALVAYPGGRVESLGAPLDRLVRHGNRITAK